MRKKIIFLFFFIMLFLFLFLLLDCKGKNKNKKFPEGPAFESVLCPVLDEGNVKPLKKSDKPIKIAVLGLENNPFWIPVKEGTHKAAQELRLYNCSVD